MMIHRISRIILFFGLAGIGLSIEPTSRPYSIDTIHVLPKFEHTNKTELNKRCEEIFVKCNNATTFEALYDYGPLRPDPSFSNLIRFRRRVGMFPTPVEINDNFLEQLTLLYNNADQLRVMLSLMRSHRELDWLYFVNGYTACDKASPFIFTCINDTCTEYNLLRLNYTNDLFSENVIGFDLFPPFLFVLVLLRNKSTDTEAVIRIPTDSISLLDATYNLMRSVSDTSDFGYELVETLLEYRDLFPTLYPLPDQIRQRIIRRHRHGSSKMDVETRRDTRRSK
uniref:Envelope glycoprotein L n=1 Tax=Mastomys natalensis cytomegalovirus 1 TaxID=2973541 RepID=A0A9Y1IQN9_9BETA|nr:envelope glycoprotein L [Mastomys natalensis cytomegalovirus 1]WEG71193.1 envelope glycoprotein L [Mastomys natalensis cytomegalovirus 1]